MPCNYQPELWAKFGVYIQEKYGEVDNYHYIFTDR